TRARSRPPAAGEQREEPVVGEQGRPLPGLVLAVLLDHGHREGQPGTPRLEVVDGVHQPLDRFHGLLVPTRYFDTPAPTEEPSAMADPADRIDQTPEGEAGGG